MSKKIPYDSYEGKLVWMRSLKVGDRIEDCRYKVIKIKEIDHETHEGDDGICYDAYIQSHDGFGCSAMNCCDFLEDEDKNKELGATTSRAEIECGANDGSDIV